MSIQTINPATNKVIKTFEEMTDAVVDKEYQQPQPDLKHGSKQIINQGQPYCIK